MRWTCKHFANTALVAGVILLSGCAGYNRAVSASDTNPVVARGNWEHLPAAVQAAVGPNEFAVLNEKFAVTDAKAEFELVSVNGNSAMVTATRRDKDIELAASVDSVRESAKVDARRLLRDIKLRLGQLAEKGWAPLPDGW